MENGVFVDTRIGSSVASAISISCEDDSRRTFLRAAGLLAAGFLLPEARAAESQRATEGSGHKVVVAIIGGVRRAETFSREGLENIPHLAADLAPKSLFYPHARNEGVTAHFNAISSILTGNWQRVDDWGKLLRPLRRCLSNSARNLRVDRRDTWVVASNKALTSLIGASSASDYGPAYGANVVFPKQLMLMAIDDALRDGTNRPTWRIAARLRPNWRALWRAATTRDWAGTCSMLPINLILACASSIEAAIASFVHGGGPTSGDELTFFMTREIMRKFAPQLLVVVFSDVEAAHFGSYALHLAGIQNGGPACLSALAGGRSKSRLPGTRPPC